jgi:hypothetical protein
MIITLNLLAFGGIDYLNNLLKDYYVSGDGRPDPFSNYRLPIAFMFITLIGFGTT